MSDLNLKRIKEERSVTFNAYQDYQVDSDEDDEDKGCSIKQLSGFKTQLEIWNPRSLMAYVQENDAQFQLYASYI